MLIALQLFGTSLVFMFLSALTGAFCATLKDEVLSEKLTRAAMTGIMVSSLILSSSVLFMIWSATFPAVCT